MNNEDDLSKLKDILLSMNKETPLETLCENLERESYGKMTFTQLRAIIDKLYPATHKNDKVFLLRNISIKDTSDNPQNAQSLPMIKIFDLFEFFSKVLDSKIASPILAFYTIAVILEKKLKISTLEYIYKINLTLNSEININEFYKTITETLKIDDLTSILVFKGLDYQKKGKIRVEDFVLVIDSYRGDLIPACEKANLSTNTLKLQRLKILLDKNFVSISELFALHVTNKNLNYLEYDKLLALLAYELKEEEEDTGDLIKSCLDLVARDHKIFKDELEKALQDAGENKEDKDKLRDTMRDARFNLNDFQLYWINKYLNVISSVNITPKMAFELACHKATPTKIDIENLKRQLKLLLPIGRASSLELNSMMDALDINKTGILTSEEYKELMDIVEKANKANSNLSSNLRKSTAEPQMNRSLINNLVKGVKSINYHLLPVKGNFKVLSSLKMEIEKSFQKTSNGSLSQMKKLKSQFSEESVQGTNLMLPGDKELEDQPKNEEQLELQDDSAFIQVFENFSIKTTKGLTPTYSLFVYLITQISAIPNLTRPMIAEIVKEIDKNHDGFISYLDIIHYLLREYKHRSTKLSYKWISTKILTEGTTEEFFAKNGIDVKSEINPSLLSDILFKLFQFENPISKKIYEEMKIIYSNSNPSEKLKIKNLVQLIDEFREDEEGFIINKNENENETDQTKENISMSMECLENGIKKFIYQIIENDENDSEKNLPGYEVTRIKKFRENLKCILDFNKKKSSVEIMNFQQFKANFIKPVRMDLNLALAIFQLIKNISPTGEQLVAIGDLLTFLESYVNDVVLEDSEAIDDIEKIIVNLELESVPIRYAFENIPFSKKGFVTASELILHLKLMYPRLKKSGNYTTNFSKKILTELDPTKTGMISYFQLQTFLFSFSKRNNFSIDIEIKHIASLIANKLKISSLSLNDSKSPSMGYFSSESYSKSIGNLNEVNRKEHSIITQALCTNKINREELYNYLCQVTGRGDYYDISALCEMIDYYISSAFEVVDSKNEEGKLDKKDDDIPQEEGNEVITIAPPISEVESMLNLLNIGDHGLISVHQILSAFKKKGYKEAIPFVKELDDKKTGCVEYTVLIKKLRDLYGKRINLSLSLNAKYIYRCIVQKKNSGFNLNEMEMTETVIEKFIEKQSGLNLTSESGNIFITKDNFQDKFLLYFANDSLLLHNFFVTYNDKKGKNKGLLSLSQFAKYIYVNNRDDIPTIGTSDIEEAISQVLSNIEANVIPVKGIYDFFNFNDPEICLKNDFSVSAEYFAKLLRTKLALDERSTQTVLTYFRSYTNATPDGNNIKFNLRKFTDYALTNCEKSKCDIDKEILPKIKNFISKSNINDYTQFIRRYFIFGSNSNINLIDMQILLQDAVKTFPNLFRLNNYQSIVLFQDALKNGDAGATSLPVNQFFECYQLKDLFTKKSDTTPLENFNLDPPLRLALKKLADYFDKEKDKLRLFKKFDTDKNGILSVDEFVTALNSCKDLGLNDSQKISVLKVADKDKDGKINPVEFLNFLKMIKSVDQPNSQEGTGNTSSKPLPPLAKPAVFIPKIIENVNTIKQNYDANVKKVDFKSKDKFLNNIVILQEDLIKNFSSFDCIEQDFTIVDESVTTPRQFLADVEKYSIILRKRLLRIDNDMLQKFIAFANEGLSEKEKARLKSIGKINYKNFLMNLANYKIPSNGNNRSLTPKLPPPSPPPPRGTATNSGMKNISKPKQIVNDYEGVNEENEEQDVIVSQPAKGGKNVRPATGSKAGITSKPKNVVNDYEGVNEENEEQDVIVNQPPKGGKNARPAAASKAGITSKPRNVVNDYEGINDENEEQDVIVNQPPKGGKNVRPAAGSKAGIASKPKNVVNDYEGINEEKEEETKEVNITTNTRKPNANIASKTVKKNVVNIKPVVEENNEEIENEPPVVITKNNPGKGTTKPATRPKTAVAKQKIEEVQEQPEIPAEDNNNQEEDDMIIRPKSKKATVTPSQKKPNIVQNKPPVVVNPKQNINTKKNQMIQNVEEEEADVQIIKGSQNEDYQDEVPEVKKPIQNTTTKRPNTSNPANKPKTAALGKKNQTNQANSEAQKPMFNIKQKQNKEIQPPVDPQKDAGLGEVYLGNIGAKLDLSSQEEIDKAKQRMSNLFVTKKDETGTTWSDPETRNTIGSTPDDKKNFMNFISKVNNLDYQGYQYTLSKDDYFIRPDGSEVRTILNSEDAAIKKCEEILKSLTDGQSFFDLDFGSQPNDNGRTNKKSLYSGEQIPKGSLNPTLVEWYPLSRIADSAKFFDDGVESNDVVQGALGDCWFISALSVLATKDYLLRGEFNEQILEDGEIDDEENVMLSTGVYPPIFHGFRKSGIFCMRFFKDFKWRYVIIDDRLPCNKVFNKNQTPKVIYGKCRNESEFWVPLIEKAYAKLHGSYEALISGFIDDGLVDLTGLAARKIMIEQEDRVNPQKIEKLWNLIKFNSAIEFGEKAKDKAGKELHAKVFTRNNTMMGCSVDPSGSKVEMEVVIDNQQTGILCGHAYAILDAFEIAKPNGVKRKFSRLLRIRNPWGRKEWTGKWSDDSEEIVNNKKKIQDALSKKYAGTNEKVVLDEEDGTFLMCFSDFRKIFNKLFICMDFPPSILGVRFYGQWTSEESGGLPFNNRPEEYVSFAKNPQYYLKIERDAMLFISLLQGDGRLSGAKFPFPQSTRKACLLIVRTVNGQKIENLNELVDKSFVVQRRDINMYLPLEKGEYVIIPSTFNKEDTGAFCLEVYFPDERKATNKNTTNKEFSLDQLRFTKMSKLGGLKSKCELIADDRGDEITIVKDNKKFFIYHQFQNCLKDTDTVDYTYQDTGDVSSPQQRKKKKNDQEEKEVDYDEY